MKNYIDLYQKLFLLFLFSVVSISIFTQIVYLDENMQDWANRNKYGNYTQTVYVGDLETEVVLTNCLVSSGAAANDECSSGRIQIREETGSVELPEIPSISNIQLGLSAGAKDRELALQYLENSKWKDLFIIEGISTKGKIFAFNLNFDTPTKLRLTSANKTVYVHDIMVMGGDLNCVSSNLEFEVSDTVFKDLGDVDFTIKAVSKNKLTEIKYSSSNPQVATVNSKTGEVNILSMGKTLIKAIQEEGEYEGDVYCMSQASYPLQVGLGSKTILSVERTSTDFITYAGGSCSCTIEVKGKNLKSDVNLEIRGKDASSFKVMPNKLQPVDGVIDKAEVVITYSPYTVKEENAILFISSDLVEGIEVELHGSAVKLVGEGSIDNPFLVSDVKVLNNAYASSIKYWVEGYIIGIPTQGNSLGHLTKVKTEFPFTGQTSVALAGVQDEEDVSKMIGVQLPKGEIRDALNLEDNPDNYKRKILVYGTLEAYFSSAPGIRGVSDFQIGITSVEEFLMSQARVFVSNNEIVVDLDKKEEVFIYNLLGNEVFRKILEPGVNRINTLDSGVYIIKSASIITKVCLFQ